MKKILCALFILALTVIPGSDIGPLWTEEAFVKTDGEPFILSREVTYYDGLTIENISASDHHEIITYSEDGVSTFYYDYATGLATQSVNGTVQETYNMRRIRKSLGIKMEKIMTWDFQDNHYTDPREVYVVKD